MFTFLFVAIALGVLMRIGMPILGSFDEPAHYLRASQISLGGLLPQQLGSNRYGGEVRLADRQFASRPMDLQSQTHSLVATEFSNTAIYPPLAYLPQAAGIALARLLGLSVASGYWLAIAAASLCYLALVGTALLVFPAFRWLTAMVALMPLPLAQAFTVSADPLNFTLPLLLLAITWHIRATGRPAGHRSLVAIASLCLALPLLKPTALVFLGFLLLLPRTAFHCSFRCEAYRGVLAIGAVVIGVAWNAKYPFIPGEYFGRGADPAAQLSFLLEAPQHFFQVVIETIKDRSWIYWHSAFGLFFPPEGRTALWTSWSLAAGVLIGLTLLALREPAGPDRNTPASVFLLVAISGVAGSALAFWMTFTPPRELIVRGIQGRYLILYFLAFFMAVGLFRPLRIGVSSPVIVIIMVSLYAAAAWQVFSYYRW